MGSPGKTEAAGRGGSIGLKEVVNVAKSRQSGGETPGGWSARVTRESHALELDAGVFTWKDPKRIARSLKRSADQSDTRKSPPFRSAMSMLTFYINRAGSTLDDEQRQILEAAKTELRKLYGRKV